MKVAGCDSPEEVEDAASESGFEFDVVTVDATSSPGILNVVNG